MRKNIWAILCLAFMLLCLAVGSNAQQAPSEDKKVTAEQVMDDAVVLMRQDIRSQKKQLVAANLPLTEAEAVKFWPVYDKYTAEHSKIYDTRYALIKDYSKNYNNLSDVQANEYIKRSYAIDQQLSALHLKWVAEFEKVVSPKKTAMFFQIDCRIWMMVELQLASQIPLLKP